MARLTAVYQYSIPLSQPLKLAHGTLLERSGLLLKFQHDRQVSWGEAAPLPGFSQESLAQVKEKLWAWLHSQAAFNTLPASLQFAIEMGRNPLAPTPPVASAQLLLADSGVAPRGKVPMDTSSPSSSASHSPLGSENDTPRCHTALGQPTDPVIKIKVGQAAITDEIKRFIKLKQAFPKALWRLDGNRIWSLKQALQFAEGIGSSDAIAFIEEPCSQLEETQAFAQGSGWPVALDETLQQPGYQAHFFQGLTALVCKPTLVGSLSRCQQLAEFAKDKQLDFILSGSFESNLTHAYLNALASKWSPNGHHGLDTLAPLGADLIGPRASGSKRPLIKESQLEQLWQS